VKSDKFKTTKKRRKRKRKGKRKESGNERRSRVVLDKMTGI